MLYSGIGPISYLDVFLFISLASYVNDSTLAYATSYLSIAIPDLVVTSLVYDTFIFLANLFIVFMDGNVSTMVVDILALEFFTKIDDEFKTALLDYDSTILYDMTMSGRPSESSGPQRHQREVHSATMIPPLAEAFFVPGGSAEPGGDRRVATGEGLRGRGGDHKTCCDVAGDVACFPFKVLLLILRACCLIVGPLIAFLMIFYGPVCLGMPER